jgi:hypothetical protein
MRTILLSLSLSRASRKITDNVTGILSRGGYKAHVLRHLTRFLYIICSGCSDTY